MPSPPAGCFPLLGRLLRKAILLDLGAAAITAAVCWFSGWRTPAQYSDALFFAALVAIFIGGGSFLSGASLMRRPESIYLEERASTAPYQRRIQIMLADRLAGQSFMLQLGLAGALLMVVAILVSKLFG